MSTTIDTRGLSCPQPVLMFMDAAKLKNANEIIVLADNNTAKENVSRAAENKKYTIKNIEQQGDEYKIFLVKDI